jgi:hypothetical protein
MSINITKKYISACIYLTCLIMGHIILFSKARNKCVDVDDIFFNIK